MSTHPARSPRTLAGPLLGLAVALGGTAALAGCSGQDGTGVSPAAAASSTSASPTSASPSSAPAAQQVPLGTKATLPSDTVQVSRFLGTAAPAARKPDTPGTHWASFDVTQCAVTDSHQASWEVALADGGTASEPTSWPEELPDALLPMEEGMPAGSCVHGRVYVAMPDGAAATAVVMQPRALNPTRPEVRWVIGRTSAAS